VDLLPRLPTALSERQFSRFVLVFVTLGFAALLAAGGMVGFTLYRTQDHARWVAHTYDTREHISTLRGLVERMEASRRGYLLSNDPSIQKAFDRMVADEAPQIDAIRRLTVDNPAQQRNVAELDRLAAAHRAILIHSIAAARLDPAAGALMFQSDGSLPLVRGIRRKLEAMVAEEQRLLAIRTQAQRQGVVDLYVGLTIAGLIMLIVAIFSVSVIRRYTHSLLVSRNAITAAADQLEERVRERTRDLSRANEEIQRFAYIVSHDLRSPLVNVMGFTGELEAATRPLGELVERAEQEAPEILTEEARLAAREDLPEAIGFIRTSTQKMDRLINAILRLSREGKRVLSPGRIDLVQVNEQIVGALQHRLDELGAKVEVVEPMPPIVADRLAVEQILSNLVENAVKYLKPGRPGRIVVSARAERDRVVIEVADNGRGIDPRDHDRIFDLFRRSGTQDQPGEGIGLAHVRALAYRLGGLIDCRSALDEGATFILSLPATPPSNEGSPA
jgi:signal transduction histidine kinase